MIQINERKMEGSIYWITSFYEDRRGTIWLGTNGGLVSFDQTTKSFTKYLNYPDKPSSISDNNVSAICEDELGNLWVGTHSGGLNIYDKKLKTFSHFTHDKSNPESINSNDVEFIFFERSGTVWVGLHGGGVNKISARGISLKRYNHEDKISGTLSSDTVKQISNSKSGLLWVVTSKGLDKFDPITDKFINVLRENSIKQIVEDKNGSLWIGTGHGLYKYGSNKKLICLKDSSGREFHGDITCISEGHDGRIWVGANTAELLLLNPYTNKLKLIYNYNILSMNTVYEDTYGFVWAGMWEGGITRYDIKNHSTDQFTPEWEKPAVLTSSYITSIYEAKDGTIWFGSYDGINKYDRQTNSFTQVLNAGGAGCILEDDMGNIYMDNYKGISKYNTKTNELKYFDLPIRVSTGYRASNGEFFFGGPQGIFRIRPEDINDNSYITPIVITSLRIFEKPFPFEKEIHLPYTKNFISFEFSALSYVDPESNQYSYMMEGLDTSWIYSGNRHYASYPNMEPGEYIFRVKGSNNDGVWNEAGTSVTIIITPPWWKTWWFTTFFWLAIVGSVGGTIRFIEIKKLKKKIEHLEQERALERERIRISQDMHDEVGSSLTEISILSEILKKNISKPNEVETHLRNISDRSAEVIENIGQIIWAINPRNDPLDNLVAYLRLYTADYLRKMGIKFHFEIPDIIPVYHFSAEVRRNIFLVLKEALHNIVKHSNATEVQVGVEFLEENMKIIIKDNGKGFLIDRNSGSGNGLINMQKRIENIGGKFNIESEPMLGTSITVVVKFVP